MDSASRLGKESEGKQEVVSSELIHRSIPQGYLQLQRRIYLTTVLISALAFLITFYFFDFRFASSFLIGSLSGVLYLRLLARSIGKIGESKSLGKIQLIVPILLFVAVSKLSQFDLLPSILGFFLYKPSLILQYLLESRVNTDAK
tara:strand:- start:3161 stop:3595 length:435 start_codon:yes stop_codon:yes gene_type:complete